LPGWRFAACVLKTYSLISFFMRWPRPKSLYSLLLTGFALVSIPLLLGVVIAAT
jgi:hypothetical protein